MFVLMWYVVEYVMVVVEDGGRKGASEKWGEDRNCFN